ncbi:ferritin-like protein [Nocardia sp. NBC_00881]|uniref:ferritin-like domain-containing protein n=1 Tax=Nocardia sp. NBC_00881 TaxID=2975995 RepID=UPI00386416BE|nr:ferritin-like protein [Nocardia sp. NBC_00881]
MNEQQIAPTPIHTFTELTAALQLAVGVELSTIPVYLTALYSIKEGHNADAAQTIRSVVMEEMLHMTLAANVLNALGKPPSPEPVDFQHYTKLSPIPAYPLDSSLISGLGKLDLRPFTPDAVKTFIRIEHPLHGADYLDATAPGYQTIGQFYDAITTALRNDGIVKDSNFVIGYQVPDTQYYGGAGEVIQVSDRRSALDAINKIVAEGEGLPLERLDHVAKQTVADSDKLGSGWEMYSHFARFRELQAQRRFRHDQTADEAPAGAMLLVDYHAVHPALHVPRGDQPADSVEGAALIEFDLAYSQLVDDLYRALSGQDDDTSGTTAESPLARAVHGMYVLKNMAVGLMRTTNPVHHKHTLCPRFYYAAKEERDSLREHAESLRGRTK